MIKYALISIRPQWAYLILTGKKTLEIRKQVLKWVKEEITNGNKVEFLVYITKSKPELLYCHGCCGDNGSCSSAGYILNDYLSKDGIKEGIEEDGDILLNGTIPFSFECDVYDLILFQYGQGYIDDEYIICNDKEEDCGLLWQDTKFIEKTCLEDETDIENYGMGKDLYALHISNVKVFDQPKTLSEFNVIKAPQNMMTVYGKE